MKKNMKKAKWIMADGKILEVAPANNTYFELEELQTFVGGYIEFIYPPAVTHAVMVVNEEGKLRGLPHNDLATRMWQQFAHPESERMNDPVVGNVLLCHRSQLR
jgi:hypothetical protein